MEKSEIRINVLKCMENIGIFVDVNDYDIVLDNYIEDSIQFITLVIEMENIFNIEIPDDLLTISNFESINKICELLEVIIK